MDISKQIIEIRESKKIKQIEMAERLSMDRQNYARLEKRGDKLTIEQLKQIAMALGVSLAEILDIEMPESNEVLEKGKQIDQLKAQLEEKGKYNELLLDRLERFEGVLGNYLFAFLNEASIQVLRVPKGEERLEDKIYDQEPIDDEAVMQAVFRPEELSDDELKIIFERALVFDDIACFALEMGLSSDKRLKELYKEHKNKMVGKKYLDYWFGLLKNRVEGEIRGMPII